MKRMASQIDNHLTADDITALRKSLKVTQEAFAKLMNVSYVTVNRWEQDKTTPSSDQVEKLLALKNILGKKDIDPNKFVKMALSIGLGTTIFGLAGIAINPLFSAFISGNSLYNLLKKA